MNALVTGATGFLGGRLSYRLKEMGYNVTALGRNSEKGKELTAAGIKFVPFDLYKDCIHSKKPLMDVCKGQDYVFHCAALSSPWGSELSFKQANVIATENLLTAAKEANIKRFIHVSTPSLYFHYNERLNVSEDEELPKQFVNHYAKTKWLAEEKVDEAFRGGLPSITIRPRALFGPGDTTIIPRLIQANKTRYIPIIDGGRTLIDLTYIDNVVDALLLCATSPSHTLGEKYNISNGEPTPLIDLLSALFTRLEIEMKPKHLPFKKAFLVGHLLEWVSTYCLFGKEPTFSRYTVSVLGKSQTLDISKAKKDLNYQPLVSVEEGLDRFARWWKQSE